MCNMLHKNLKDLNMFDFTKQTKQYEELAARIKEMNDFWVNIVMDTWKDLYSKKK